MILRTSVGSSGFTGLHFSSTIYKNCEKIKFRLTSGQLQLSVRLPVGFSSYLGCTVVVFIGETNFWDCLFGL
jgi:hypothetical protein